MLAEALVARRDVLGERLLAAREGPSYAAVSRALPPLWYAVGHGGLRLTRSGAYYLTFAYPRSLYGEKAFALHVADGSAIVTRRSDGPSLTVLVGDGREVYGSCVARLGPPRLARGWLPVLRTRYVDARGVRYAQESFAGRVPGIRSLVSFVRLTVDARRAGSTTATVRFVASPGSRARLVTDGRGAREHDGVRYGVRGVDVLRVAWVHSPSQGPVAVDETVVRRRPAGNASGSGDRSSRTACPSTSPSDGCWTPCGACSFSNGSSPGATASGIPTRSSRSQRRSTLPG